MMDMTGEQLTDLMIKYVTNQASARERRLIEELMQDEHTKARIEEIKSREGFLQEKALWDEAGRAEGNSLAKGLAIIERHGHGRKLAVPRFWLAAAAIFAIAISIFIITRLELSNRPTNQAQPIPTDLPPGSQRALLVLGNGRQIVLDSAKTGELVKEAGATIQRKGRGEIDYTTERDAKASAVDARIVYNILKTPRGGFFKVVLPDRSVVYLNSESSLTFPTDFSPYKPRIVSLMGEAFFEVVHDPSRPFKVETRGKTIEALGTSFNVNAYDDESTVQATLIEGSVKASDSVQSALLHPGDQAILLQRSIEIKKQVDTDAVIGWKRGDFVFNNAPLSEVIRQLSRWYDVTVVFDSAKVSNMSRFTAEISRNRPASEVLKALAVSGYHFNISGGGRIAVEVDKP